MEALYKADRATLDDLRDAVKTLEDTQRIARRVFGGAHPNTEGIEHALANARTVDIQLMPNVQSQGPMLLASGTVVPLGVLPARVERI